jgi:hypothetical protein
MKTFINIVAFLVFIVQIISFFLNALNLKSPDNATESLYNGFVLTAFICSLLSIAVFVIFYNCNFRLIKNTIFNIISLVIVLLGGLRNLLQLFVLHDFIFSSCISLLFDSYVIYKILYFLFRVC